MGALKFVWDAVEVSLTTKIKSYQATPMDLMLWGVKIGVEIKLTLQ